LHEFYHPFDDIEFLLPKNAYAKGGSIKDYIAPSMFVFKGKEIEMGNAFCRIMFVKSFDRELDDSFLRDLLDNNKKVTVSKHLRRLDKSEALEKVNKDILNVQESIQKRKETNHAKGMDFVPFRYFKKEKLPALINFYETLTNFKEQQKIQIDKPKKVHKVFDFSFSDRNKFVQYGVQLRVTSGISVGADNGERHNLSAEYGQERTYNPIMEYTSDPQEQELLELPIGKYGRVRQRFMEEHHSGTAAFLQAERQSRTR
jgi:hypothetical protein